MMTGAGATFPCGVDPQDSNIRIAPNLPPVSGWRPPSRYSASVSAWLRWKAPGEIKEAGNPGEARISLLSAAAEDGWQKEKQDDTVWHTGHFLHCARGFSRLCGRRMQGGGCGAVFPQPGKARRKAAEWGFPKPTAAIWNCWRIRRWDTVYISTVNAQHYPWAKAALEHGKHGL